MFESVYALLVSFIIIFGNRCLFIEMEKQQLFYQRHFTKRKVSVFTISFTMNGLK
jgi:hypothetical protein